MKRLSCLLLLAVVLLLPLMAETISIGNGNVLNQGLPIEPIARYSYSQQLFMASEIGVSGFIDSLSFKYNVTSNLFFAGNKEWKIWLGHSSRTLMGSWMPLDSLYLVYDGTLSPSYFDGGLPGNGWLHIPLQQSFYYNGNANLVLAVDENTYEYGSSSDDFICTNTALQRSIQFQSQTTNPNPAAPPDSGYSYKTHRSNLRLSLQPQYFAPAMPSPANGATGVAIDTNLSWVSISDTFTLRFGTALDSLQIIEDNLSQCLWQPTAPFAYNRTYYWQVTGNYLGQPYPSAVWSFSTYSDAISPPQNLSGFYDGQVVQLSWQIPQTGSVQYYRIYRNSQPYALCTSTTWNEANVQGGVTYFYNVTALNPSGTESGFSNSACVTIPNLPAVLLSQNFETCSSFSNQVPGWQILSQNTSPTWVWDEISYPHEGEALGWITFAPAETSPPLSGHAPYNGSKMLMAMSSLNPPNNAWLISPAINLGTDSSLSFFARSAYADYGLERLRVLISVTDAAPASFRAISLGEYLSVPVGWTLYNYDLSHYGNQAVYLAWQSVSVDAFALFVDAIQVRSVGGSVAVEDAYIPVPYIRNYPNPAKGHFKLESSDKALFSFDLFDLKGRKLYAGKHVDAFDSNTLGTELASGVYLIRITAQGKSQVLKQVILK